MYSVGNFFSTVTKFYNEINPATLSGAIDIIVVQQANGDLACSPFHVRFGKLSVLRPQEKVVEVRVNGEVIAFPMKVGDAGEAFFVLETDDYVPDEFITSPIAGPADDVDLAPVDYFDLNGHPQAAQNQKQKQQKQLEGMSGQYPQDEEALLENGYVSAASGHGSAFEESLKDDSDRESIFSATSPSSEQIASGSSTKDTSQDMPGASGHSHGSLQEPGSPLPSVTVHPDQDQIPSVALQANDSVSPPIQVHSGNFPVNTIFPTVAHGEPSGDALKIGNGHSGRRNSMSLEVLFDMTGYKTDSCSGSSDDEDLPRGVLSDSERHHRRRKFGRKNKSRLSKEQHLQLLEDIKQGAFLKPDENMTSTPIDRQSSRAHRKKKRAGIPSGWQGQKGRKRANSMPTIGEPDIPFFEVERRPNQHHGDIQSSKPVDVAETLPKRTAWQSVMSDTEMEYESNEAPASTQGKGWTWGWGTLPVKQSNPDEEDDLKEEPKVPEVLVEIETREFQMGSTKCHVALSLCGDDDFGKDMVASHKVFQTAQLTFEAFSKDPAAILADKRLVCYMDGRFYSWNNAVPQLVALLFFHQPLSDSAAPMDIKDQKTAEDRPSATRFGTISRWFRKAPAGSTSPSTADMASLTSTAPSNVEADVAEAEVEDLPTHNKAIRSKSLPPLDSERANDHPHSHASVPALSEKPADGVPEKKRYAKTLRLTSEQLNSLGLKKGANTVSFSVTSSYQGTATCVAKIFLWDYDSQVVISDIDGTITKSDALGHIFAMAGRDWTHLGVAKLFTDIRSNGYHILYLTSRAIGQADYTRKYLQKVEQNSYQLPDGPVIMSPDRLFSAFHREVIIRKPEVFKMACLRDVKKLFGERNPFYAGFGNRITDALSYRSVNVPPSRIFTIDSYGEVKLELLSAFKSSYLALNDLVNEIFPGQRVAPEFNDWNFWKSDLPMINLPDLPLVPNHYGASSSSLLSSTTNVAKKVVSLTQSSSSSASLLQPSSPTNAPVDTKSRRASYERTTYAGVLLGRHENYTSDDERQDQQYQQGQQDEAILAAGPDQQHRQEQNLKDDAKKAKAGSPSMLSALVPSRLIRAVRSGSTSSQVAPDSLSLEATTTPQSPEMRGIIGSLPSPTNATDSDGVRLVSSPSPLPSDGHSQTDEEAATAVGKSLDQVQSEVQSLAEQTHSSRRNSVTAKSDDLVPIKTDEEERHLNEGLESVVHEDLDGEEDEYQGDYEDEEGEFEDEGEMDDDEYLDQLEEDLEEPFL
ncbi:hypothetical protein BG011_008035 [Mortierella polycephala]|uniref:phosphatidate phosphatase n=1 Tax=Mortierella polycephala TaxID=41804 RepID=A0A9P6PRA8_9FUNG|nr:hypothetical protein BG011_008035 [Mortierella polycephala]